MQNGKLEIGQTVTKVVIQIMFNTHPNDVVTHLFAYTLCPYRQIHYSDMVSQDCSMNLLGVNSSRKKH